ncbi:polyketide synthase, partial [Streptomyces sodiiphilus]|uniref:type I polyketide synthase n=1 Tax=Streptomyces sodiiphilus TaxID=226217 RepID=UPI0031D4CDFA
MAKSPVLSDEPIAVIGIACRVPGASCPEEFWDLLIHGKNAITGIPEGRFDTGLLEEAEPHSVHGGFIQQDVAAFDPEFFGISPREAAAMDPQQRIALELCWEAMERAGLQSATFAGSRTGVFVGAIADDYAALVHRLDPSEVTQHTLTGLSRSVIANRISYFLGLRGPSLAVDTGQSSSLAAVHLACASLRRGESTLALAGGVHLNLVPDSFLAASRFGALSPDGRSYAFDERANGYVRGEGGGIVLLKPLSRARRDGDDILCVIRGSAANNDGGGESLTTPFPAGQEDVLRAAYRQAGVSPSDVQYVELHGTGTKVGDPVEAKALGAVLGSARPAGAPLAVGSVKTNIGHLEGAAGVAGLIKTILCLRNRQLPASLNFERANPGIPLDELNLRMQTELGDWPRTGDACLRAGVSSFGMGGTNVHVVLEEAPVGVGAEAV